MEKNPLQFNEETLKEKLMEHFKVFNSKGHLLLALLMFYIKLFPLCLVI